MKVNHIKCDGLCIFLWKRYVVGLLSAVTAIL
jgi:hypothetical protein